MSLRKARKSQAAIDFVTSYGIALVIVTIAIAVIYKTSILSPSLVTSSCSPIPGFSCDAYAINAITGVLTVTLSQATGGPININGAACSSLGSSSGSGPQFGNLGVTGNTLYYPGGVAPSSNTVYSDSGATLQLNCYSSAGLASGPVGNSFIGYLWLNYTVPSYGNTIQQVASLNLVYS
jgi:hypothetical protein